MTNRSISNEEWAQKALSHLHYGGWNVKVYGPVSGQCGCRCPQNILKQIAIRLPRPLPSRHCRRMING
jgi:hypothetical protein